MGGEEDGEDWEERETWKTFENARPEKMRKNARRGRTQDSEDI
jgi:hypothetical protein